MNFNSSGRSRTKSLFLATSFSLAACLIPGFQEAHAEQDRHQYCDDRGNACHDHEPSSSRESPRSAPSTDPAPADPAPADPEPTTPDTPT